MSFFQNYNLLKLAFKYPALTLKKIHSRYQKEINLQFPALLNFFLYPGCNLRCSMCGQRRWEYASGDSLEKEYLTLEKLKDIVDEAEPYSPEIYIWGGEPTLHPDFGELITYIKKKGMVCTVNTNGTMLKKWAGDIVASGVDSVDVSLDGPADVHDGIRGITGTYMKVMEGLAELERKRKSGKNPLVKAIITLSEGNLSHIERLLAELEEHRAIQMSIIQLGWFVTEAAGRSYEKRLKDDFGIEKSSWTGFRDDNAGERALKSKKLIQRVRKGRFKKPILFFPDLKNSMIERYYTDHSDPLNGKGCRAVYKDVNIRPDGTIVICGDYPDIAIGNVHQQTIQEIWTGEKRRKLRSHLETNGLFSICTRCCGYFR